MLLHINSDKVTLELEKFLRERANTYDVIGFNNAAIFSIFKDILEEINFKGELLIDNYKQDAKHHVVDSLGVLERKW